MRSLGLFEQAFWNRAVCWGQAGGGHEESGAYLCEQCLGPESPRQERDAGVGWLAMLAGCGGRKQDPWSWGLAGRMLSA